MTEKVAQVVYRKNEKLDTIYPIVESGLQRESEFRGYSAYETELKKFPSDATEEDIRCWAQAADLSAVDMIFSDRTFGRAIKDQVGDYVGSVPMFSLDKVYQEASEKAAENLEGRGPQGVSITAADGVKRTVNEEVDNVFEKYVWKIEILNKQPEKLYIAWPKIQDHNFFPYDEGIEEDDSEKEIAKKLGSAFEEAGYDVEIVEDYLAFDEMDEDSWFLVDSHYARDHEPREQQKGSKIELSIDGFLASAFSLGLWEDKRVRNKAFEEELGGCVGIIIGDIKEDSGGEYQLFTSSDDLK